MAKDDAFKITFTFVDSGFELVVSPLYVAVHGVPSHGYFVSCYSSSVALTCLRPFWEPPEMDLCDGILATCPVLLGTFLADEPHTSNYWQRSNLTDIEMILRGDVTGLESGYLDMAEYAHLKILEHWATTGNRAQSFAKERTEGFTASLWRGVIGEA